MRNPGQQALANSLSDTSANDRHAAEKAFFKSEEPWSNVSKDRVGVEALRIRLVEILAEMIKREFPRVRIAQTSIGVWPVAYGMVVVTNALGQVKAEISAKLKLCRHQLDALGPSRATRQQQYQFLLELATQYQTITSLALKAHYGGDDVFETTPSLKLATAIVNRNTSFSDDVWQRGHALAFIKDKDGKEKDPNPTYFSNPSPFAAQGPLGTPPNNSVSPMDRAPSKSASGFGQVKSVRYEKTHLELEDIMQEDILIPLPKAAGIKQWLENVYKSSRGFELGTFDASLLPIIWKVRIFGVPISSFRQSQGS